jgi:hypothetical protein
MVLLTDFVAGWYGLKAARTYLDLQPGTKLVVFEGDDSVGGVWSKKRIYHSLVAQVCFLNNLELQHAGI